jgi:TolB-like protein/Tfp pilus assembly protein PilF
MPSLITGFEYDIFISYRQKDNKGDRWVSQFVEHLKTELEASFKEDVTVYFDENPTDRLLETHNVDKSLESKLKCLVFIPVISRTYCDPQSFAWQSELIAFRKLSVNDSFGIDIRLKNGNVASRILPVRIHDMDEEDKRLYEEATGGVMRAIDFVFKTSAGVNRPLIPNEDHPSDNLNKTFYRDQVNKVANAIRDIITSMRSGDFAPVKDGKSQSGNSSRIEKTPVRRLQLGRILRNLKIKNRIIAALSMLLVAALLFAAYDIFLRRSGHREKSVAVMLFLNYNQEKSQEIVTNELTGEIISNLYKIKSFDKVVSLLSVLPYKDTDKKVSQIAEELGVNYILEGTYRKTGNRITVNATLIDPETEKILWQNKYDTLFTELLAIQADISISIAEEVKAFITNPEKQYIQKVPTTNQEAYELIKKGLYLWNTRNFRDLDQMLEMTRKAIELDPEYADAYAFAGLLSLLKVSVWGGSELQSVVWDANAYLDKALDLDKENCTAHLGMALFYDWIRWDYVKAEQELKKILELEPNNPQYLELYVEFLLKRNQPDKAIKIKVPTEQAYRLIQANIVGGRKNESLSEIRDYLATYGSRGEKYAGDCFIWMQMFDSAKVHLEKALSLNDPDVTKPRFQAYLALAYDKTGNRGEAEKIVEKLEKMSKVTSANSPEYFVGWYFMGSGRTDSAFVWLDKAYANHSTQLTWLNVDPVYNSVRNDQRFMTLYNKTGHNAYKN